MRLLRTMALATLLSACTTSSGGEAPDEAPGADAASSTPTSFPVVSSTPPTSTPPSTASSVPAATTISIQAGEVSLTATLRDTAAARSLLAQLPVSVDMSDHGGVEKTGRLPAPLDIDDEPDGADPDPGQLGYYAPGWDLVLYYGDQDYFDGIVVLGDLTGDLDALGAVEGDVTVAVSAS